MKWIKTENNEFLCVLMISRFYLREDRGSQKIYAETPNGEIFAINSFSSEPEAWDELTAIINELNESPEDR